MNDDGGLGSFCLELPKVELHVHLEGSVQPRTLLALARRRGIELPATDEAGLAEWFRFRDFDHFVDVYLTCSRCLRDPEDFQLLVADFLAEQARQNIYYSEVHFTIGTHVANGANPGEVADAMWQAVHEGERQWGVTLRLIPDMVRNLGPRAGEVALGWAIESRRFGVIALGLSGSEAFPAAPFAEHFRVAAEEGLHTVAHAGEQAGPDSIAETLDACAPERIGHGIAASRDPALMERLAAAGIPLEVCPSSNVALGFAESLEEHPFDELYRAGVAVSINSDDPQLFDTSLTDEYQRLADAFGYEPAELASLARGAVAHAFLEPDERREIVKRMELRLSHLGIA